MKNVLLVTAVFAIALVIWEVFSYFNQNFIFVLPAPSQVIARLWEKGDRFLFHTNVTFQEMIWGGGIAFLAAFPLAWMMDLFKSARAILQPLFIIIQCVPMFTLAPIMVIWFGWSSTAIIVPTALMIFFPLTMSIYQGLRAVPQELLDYFKANQATTWQIFSKLKLPWALPHIFGGFRVSTAIAGIAAVAGEWAGAQTGLGVLMVESRRDTDLETTFAALCCLTALSCLLYVVAVGCEYLAAQRRPLKVIFRQLFTQMPLRTSTFLLAALGLIGVSCQSQESFNKGEPVRLTLDWLPNPNHIPLYVGINKGYFSEEGIHLVLHKLQEPGHTTPYLTSGQVELTLSYMPHTIRVTNKGAEILPIGILIKEPLNAIIYREDLTIGKPQDLSGKTIGYCTGSKDCAFMDAFLAENKIAPGTKRNVGFDLVTCLGTGMVDAIYGAYWNIESQHLRSLGIQTKYFKLSEFGIPNYYELIVLARKNSTQADPEFIHRFQTALQRSIDYAKTHPEEAFEIYAKLQPDKSEKTKQWELEAWKITIPALANSQEVSGEVWRAFEQWLKNHQLL